MIAIVIVIVLVLLVLWFVFFCFIQIIDTSRDSMTWGHTTIFVHRRRG